MWEWVKEIVTAEVLNNKLTLPKAEREYATWQVVALMGSSLVC
jgi:hypothetical protein